MKHSSAEPALSWWHLSLIGAGGTIGTGYFLGTGIALKSSGGFIIPAFLIAAFATWIVYKRLATMTMADPCEGSFCTYAGKAYGSWAAFLCGWIYWISTILIMGGQLTALGILSRYWFPSIPLWVFTLIFAVLSISVVLLGARGFDVAEDFFSIIKLSALVIFLFIGAAWLLGGRFHLPENGSIPLSEGFSEVRTSLIFAFYSFAGIEVIGLMASRLSETKDILKSGRALIICLGSLYVMALWITLNLQAPTHLSSKESPFISVLNRGNVPIVASCFNGVILLAGFSALAAALFSVTRLLRSMADEGEAPAIFKKRWKRDIPLPSLLLSVAGMTSAIIASHLLPGIIFEAFITAAGILLLCNWAFILLSSFKLLDKDVMRNGVSLVALGILVLAISGTFTLKESRYGFYLSMVLLLVIGLASLLFRSMTSHRSMKS
ncbi:amino acid permease [Rossellomorea marisflavi]|uniref:amino acid permease n=1 Tax=Rossellomorea marisflavi TaxID=189381 RepID=UPI003F9F1650